MNKKYQIAGYILPTLLLLPTSTQAVSCGSIDGSGSIAVDATVLSDCTNLVTTNLGILTINSGVTVADDVMGGGEAVINEPGAIQTFNNIGSIESQTVGSGSGIWNKSGATINSFNNIGSISTVGGTGLYNDGLIGNFSNSGSIYAASLSGDNGEGITNEGTIDSLTNEIGGTITVENLGSGIWNTSTGAIGELNNKGTILSTNGYSIYNNGSITTLINSGLLYDTLPGYMIYSSGFISTLINSGEISTGADGVGIFNAGGSIATLTNRGLITVGEDAAGIQLSPAGTIDVLNNFGTITAANGYAIYNEGLISALNNSGNINDSANGYAIYNDSNISSIINTGTISTGINGTGIFNGAGAVIVDLTNLGTISSDTGGIGINNDGGVIATLNNAQGAGSVAGPLTYRGALPENYNIIIRSSTDYGQFQVDSIRRSTIFGISSLSGSVLKGTYSSVLSGINSSQITSLSGSYNGAVWALTSGNNNLWNLIYGLSTADTQASLVNTASSLQSTYALQNSVLANTFSYDCSLFDKNNICISAGGRNTAVSAANGLNNTSGLLIAAYRPHQHYRLGAYIDQNLSVNNAGSTVALGNNTPLVGLFGVWNQRLNGTGAELKVAAAYGQKNTTISRGVVGDSEAGSGSSQLNSQGAQVVAKYGFGITENTVVSPYVGMRYTQNNMGGYTEGSSSTVTAPLTYSALNTSATTALVGVGARHRLTPKTMLFASAGVESDTNTSNGTYSASGINGLTPVNFNASPVTTRPTASVGATYLVEKNQQLGLSGIYRQEPYQAVSTTTVFLTYTIGL